MWLCEGKTLHIIIFGVDFIPFQIDGFYVTSRPVQESPRLTSLISLVTSDIDYRYTDSIKVLSVATSYSIMFIHRQSHLI